jgi:ABC-type Fe3+-hydroxamate transport system substrate-binding protein
MVAGRNTFINDMLRRCGMENAFADTTGRYPQVTLNDVQSAEPDALLLPSEPFPFREKHRTMFAERFPDAVVQMVDGEMYSWYGSRLLLAVDYLKAQVRKLG